MPKFYSKILKIIQNSSLHWSISLSFSSFSYSGVCYNRLKLSVDGVIIGQKGLLLKKSVLLDIEQGCDQKRTEGNILHCMKKTRDKTRIGQWRLVEPWKQMQAKVK